MAMAMEIAHIHYSVPYWKSSLPQKDLIEFWHGHKNKHKAKPTNEPPDIGGKTLASETYTTQRKNSIIISSKSS